MMLFLFTKTKGIFVKLIKTRTQMKTAFITGATEGIGYELAKIFAQNKFELILVARNESKLRQMVETFTSKGIHATYYAKDLTILENAKFIYNDLKAKNITVEYVINNAGFGVNADFVDSKWEKQLNMFQLNMITLAYFTHSFARDMKAKRFGRIMNVASTASFQPIPFMAGYAASKAFVMSLSEAVNKELKGTNVSITTLCPGVTDSKFHETAHSERTLLHSKILAVATAKEVAEYGYRRMMERKALSIHGFRNKVNAFFLSFIPRSWVGNLTKEMMKN